MKRSHIKDYEMLTKVVDFAINNVGMFPKTSAASEVVAGLKTATAELSAQAGARISSEGMIRASRNARSAARAALRTRLYLYEQVGTALSSDKFRAPRQRTDAALIDSGHAFIADGESLEKDFSKHGLPVEKLSAGVQALERSILDYTAGKAMRSSAIREFDKTIETAMVYLSRLDVLVATCLTDSPAAMASWTVARRINRTAVRKRNAKPPDPAVTEPGTGTVAAIAAAA